MFGHFCVLCWLHISNPYIEVHLLKSPDKHLFASCELFGFALVSGLHFRCLVCELKMRLCVSLFGCCFVGSGFVGFGTGLLFSLLYVLHIAYIRLHFASVFCTCGVVCIHS